MIRSRFVSVREEPDNGGFTVVRRERVPVARLECVCCGDGLLMGIAICDRCFYAVIDSFEERDADGPTVHRWAEQFWLRELSVSVGELRAIVSARRAVDALSEREPDGMQFLQDGLMRDQSAIDRYWDRRALTAGRGGDGEEAEA